VWQTRLYIERLFVSPPHEFIELGLGVYKSLTQCEHTHDDLEVLDRPGFCALLRVIYLSMTTWGQGTKHGQ
jgi:hypothetical protein